jgi:pimeloyl-ACP methyl ester carboxylesterase
VTPVAHESAAGLAFERAGSGPAVLLLHGIGGGRRIWGEGGSGTTAALAAGGFDTFALDLPGYGDSRSATPGGIAAMATQVARWQDALALPPLLIVGHSMGGMVAQELAATAPERVAGLVLACTSAAFGPPGGDWQAKFVADRLAPLDAGLGMAGMAERLVPGMLSRHAQRGAGAAAMAVMAAVPESTYRIVLAGIVAFDRRADLARIRVPTLCLAGEHDGTAPPAVLERMAARIPGVEFQVLAGAGHIANVEQPAAFNAAVLDFLQRRFLH